MKALATGLALLLLLPAIGHADEFSEYRVPEHSWTSGSATLSTSASSSYQSQTLAPHWTRRGGFNGLGSFGLSRGYDSDRRQLGWSLQGNASSNNEHQESHWQSPLGSPVTDADSRAQSGSERLVFAPWGRLYPAELPIGLEASAVLSGTWGQAWARADRVDVDPAPPSRTLSRESWQDHAYGYRAVLRVALGHGLVRDATVVEDVHVLETRLRETGSLTRALSPGAREKLAGILAVAPRLWNAHERPERFEWREIERVLREDGALGGTALDAWGLLRAREAYRLRSGRPRLRGHFVGLTLEQAHVHDILREDRQLGVRTFVADTLFAESHTELSSRQDDSRDDLRAGAQAEWHRPFGWRWQCSAATRVTLPVRPGEHGLASSTSLLVNWHVADRWEALGVASHARVYERADPPSSPQPLDRWQAGLSAELDYLLEDNVDAFARVDYGQQQYRGGAWSGRSYYRAIGLSAGISWRFLGRVSAPGLFDTMTLLR